MNQRNAGKIWSAPRSRLLIAMMQVIVASRIAMLTFSRVFSGYLHSCGRSRSCGARVRTGGRQELSRLVRRSSDRLRLGLGHPQEPEKQARG
ncbi:hypothetical protein [Sagittula sp. S175]|uniref:hypothetical protein n=1 Tax=Sagittula sp. S175 TaxID=3415129 RepID=UPI003C7BEE95